MAEQQSPVSSSARTILQEERYLWMARAFVVMLVLAVICDLILLIALAHVTPVMRVQPFYVESQSKEQQTISVSRPSAETLNSDALKESLVRQYLMARFGIESDLEELKARWGNEGPVYWMSDQSIYEGFLKNEYESLLPLAQQENFTRQVVIKTLTHEQGGAKWHAVLEFQDMDRSSVQIKKTTWNVDLAVMFRPVKNMRWEHRLKNPLGFTVVNLGLHQGETKSQK